MIQGKEPVIYSLNLLKKNVSSFIIDECQKLHIDYGLQ